MGIQLEPMESEFTSRWFASDCFRSFEFKHCTSICLLGTSYVTFYNDSNHRRRIEESTKPRVEELLNNFQTVGSRRRLAPKNYG